MPKSEISSQMRTLLLAGYKKDSFVSINLKGDSVDVYSPKILTIQTLDYLGEVYQSRCIPIKMRKSENEEVLKADVEDGSYDWELIRHHLYTLALDNFKKIRKIYNENNFVLNQLNKELWVPIFSIASFLAKNQGSNDLFDEVLEFANQTICKV
jgi:hypothetical protein